VMCSPDSFSVGGSISGLIGWIVLQNNSADYLALYENGDFVFPVPVAHGSNYRVSVKTHPPDQACSIHNNREKLKMKMS